MDKAEANWQRSHCPALPPGWIREVVPISAEITMKCANKKKCNGDIWSVAPFIPVGLGEKGSKKARKMQYFFRMSVIFFKNCIKPLLYMHTKGL